MVKMKTKATLLPLAIITIMLFSSITVHADTSILENVDLEGLSEEEFEKLYEELLIEAEEDLSKPQWLVRTWGHSWKLEPPTSEVAQPEEQYRMSMRLLATRIYVTKCGYKLYRLRGSMTHDGKTIKVFGIAILDKHGRFCMKLDADESLRFRLFGCGRIWPWDGIIRLSMKGRFKLNSVHFGFLQRGNAKRINLTSVSDTG
jgi:hypothetical protein